MPRLGWRKPEVGSRLTDHIAVGVLTHTYPPSLVDQVISDCDRREQRRRLLPSRVLVYYVLAMTLFSQSGYEEVMRYVVDGLTWLGGWGSAWHVPTKAAIFKGRTRLGVQPLKTLYERVARPLGEANSRGVWYRHWRLMSLDGTTLDVADTPDNDASFGRPGNGRGDGTSAFPKLRLVALLESGTHAAVAAIPCAYRDAESKVAPALLEHLAPNMLLLADRGFFSYPLWFQAATTGAALAWRVRADLILPVRRSLADGSYLSRIYPSPKARRHEQSGIDVRVIEYTLCNNESPTDKRNAYRLLTTILDPALAPAQDLAALYHERWEIESMFDEFKTHQRGPGVVLRSKTPEGVLQEVYGYLLTHFAIRGLMHEAALAAGEDPDRLSFTRSLHIVRRQLGRAPSFSP